MEKSRRPKTVDAFGVKPRKAIPFAFVLEALADLKPRTNPMFGCLAVYVGPKIVMVLRENTGGGPTTAYGWPPPKSITRV